MRFHHICFCTILGLISASASFAGEPDELQLRFAEQLDRSVQMQVSALVSQKLADEMEAIRIPSAVPESTPNRPSTPLGSATSARALPHGELAAARLACRAGPEGAVDCTVAPDPTRGAPVTSLAIKQ